MKDYHVDIVKRGEQLPELSERNFFHSPELFHVLEGLRDAHLTWWS